MKILRFGIILLLSVTLWGCGKGNSAAPAAIDATTGKHVVPNWVAATVHGGLDFGASKDMVGCQECHGKDYAGGISKVSCLKTAGCHGAAASSPHPAAPWRGGVITHVLVKEVNASVCADCHAKGKNLRIPLIPSYSTAAPGCFNSTLCHGQVGHSNDVQPWSAGANHGASPGTPPGRPGAKFSIQACQSCHATPSSGLNPLFTNPKTGMPGGCSSVGCHDQNVNLAHPYIWLPNRVVGINTSHATAEDLTSSCGLCHGATLTGGPNAPSCMGGPISGIVCHSGNPAASPTGCASCHGNPPSSNKHVFHLPPTIPGLVCSTCHGSSTFGQLSHANGAVDLGFNNTLFSEGGNILRPDGCTNVSCHGGKTTLSWTTGGATPILNYVYDPTGVNCTANCHGAVLNNASNIPGPFYINVYSGDPDAGLAASGGTGYDIRGFGSNNMHNFHADPSFLNFKCTDCHGIDKLTGSHFTLLSSGIKALVPGFAKDTIGGAATQISSYVYDVVPAVAGVVPGTTLKGGCTSTCHAEPTRYWFSQ